GRLAPGEPRADLVARSHRGPGDVVAHALALADPVEVGLLGRGESGRRRASPVTRSAGAVPTACAAAGAVTALCVRILIRVVVGVGGVVRGGGRRRRDGLSTGGGVGVVVVAG